MRFGFTTALITKTSQAIDYEAVRLIKDSGYDYAEFPLSQIAALTGEQFEELLAALPRIGLGCDFCSNFFPEHIRLTGPYVNFEEINRYLKQAIPRAARLGAKAVVLGSYPSRNLPEGFPKEKGMEEFMRVIRECILPVCQEHDVGVVLEPILKQLCNFINSLSDGMQVVKRINSPRFGLLADTMHMLGEKDDPQLVVDYKNALRHVHISEAERILPEDSYSEAVQAIIDHLVKAGYNKNISFEALGGRAPDSMANALQLLKRQFGV